MNTILIIALCIVAYILLIKHVMDNAPVVEDDIEELKKMLNEKQE